MSQVPLELLLGAALGFSVRLVFAGLELAAGLIDTSLGIAATAVLHPEQSHETSPSGASLAILAGLAWLTLSPVGGDLRIVAAVLDSLQTLPPGGLTSVESPVALVRDTLLAATVLGLQAAAPLVVTIGLLQTLWGVLARARGGALWHAPLTSLRTLVALLILAVTATDIGTRFATGVDGVLTRATQMLVTEDHEALR